MSYSGRANSKKGPLGKLAESAFKFEYNLDEINKLDAITLPKECADQKAATDIPLPPNATGKTTIGRLTTFKSADEPAKVTAFFSKALPSQDWRAGAVSRLGNQETLVFTKRSRTLLISIIKEPKGDSTELIDQTP